MNEEQERFRLNGKWILLGVLLLLYLTFSYSPWGEAAWNALSRWLGTEDFSRFADEYELSMQVLDVGKADAILLEQGDTAVLVDTGTYDEAGRVAEYFRKRKIETLDAVFLSHYDSDHAGGFGKLAEEFRVERLYCPRWAAEKSAAMEEILEVCRAREIPVSLCGGGEELNIASLRFELFEPLEENNSSNDDSLVFRASYRGFSALFTGDMGDRELESLLSREIDLQSDILKVPHHGSQAGISEALLERVSPRYSVISVGENRSNLPSKRAVELLTEADCETLRTDRSGILLLGWREQEGYTVKTQK